MTSELKFGLALAARAAETERRQCSIKRSSLKAGMMIERCIKGIEFPA
jgi:hypothetical protein